MKIVTNEKLIKRNSKIGQYTSIGALVILGAGLYISFTMPTKFIYSVLCLLLGFFLSQVGMYYGNKWGRHPRPDEIIDKSMKGLGREYTIYHYVTSASNLLVGPAGIWVVLPYFATGIISFEKKRWRLRGGGFAQSYLRLFGQDSLGRPDLEAEAEIESARRYLKRVLPEGMEKPPVNAALLFAHPKVELKVEGAPVPAMLPKDLKDFLKQIAKENPMPQLTLEAVRKALPQPTREEE